MTSLHPIAVEHTSGRTEGGYWLEAWTEIGRREHALVWKVLHKVCAVLVAPILSTHTSDDLWPGALHPLLNLPRRPQCRQR